MTATTVSAAAPNTNAPDSAGFARLPIGPPFRAAGEELPQARVGRMREELLRSARRDHRPAVGVEEDAVVGDREDARQFVRDHDDGRPQAVAQLEDELVQP